MNEHNHDAARMPCDEVAARLWEYIDGELDSGDMGDIREHLELCSRCFPQYDFQRAFLSFVRTHARQPIPADVRRTVFQRLLAEEDSAPEPPADAPDRAAEETRDGRNPAPDES